MLAATERAVLAGHAGWMGWNLMLAAVPLVLALALFRGGGRRGRLWWVGLVLFVGFLPNAPYVLTDAVHLVGEIRVVARPSTLVLGTLPLYGGFFGVGFGCYVASLACLGRYLRAEGKGFLVVPVEVAFHLLAAVGVFLGRFDRLNSWDLVARPLAVAAAFGNLVHQRPMAIVGLLLVTVAAAKAVAVYAARAVSLPARALWAHIR